MGRVLAGEARPRSSSSGAHGMQGMRAGRPRRKARGEGTSPGEEWWRTHVERWGRRRCAGIRWRGGVWSNLHALEEAGWRRQPESSRALAGEDLGSRAGDGEDEGSSRGGMGLPAGDKLGAHPGRCRGGAPERIWKGGGEAGRQAGGRPGPGAECVRGWVRGEKKVF